MRYVPLFADPLEWDNTRTYEPLTIVLYQGASYTSRQAVPVGIDISNTEFWALTGNYNAQVEQYRLEVQHFDGRITQAQGDATSALTQVGTVAGQVNTLSGALTALDAKVGNLPEGQTSVVGYVGDTATELDNKIGTLPEGQTSVVGYVDNELEGVGTNLAAIGATLDGFNPQTPVKGYVDNELNSLRAGLLSNLSNDSAITWDVAARHFRPTGYGIVQGFCVFELNGVEYWAQGEIKNDSDGQVNIYRIDTNTLVGSVSGNFGHIHGISYADGYLFLDGTVSGSLPAYTAISVTNPSNPVVTTPYTQIQTANPVSRICFETPNLVHMFHWGATCKVWVRDLTTGVETEKVTFTDGTLDDVTVQNIAYDAERNIYVIGTYHKSGVAIYDATTGERLNWIELPTLVQQVCVLESEGAYICNGRLYINTAEIAYTLRLASLLVWDFEHGSVLQSLEMRPAESVNGTYLRIDVSDSGDLVHPTQNNFRLASDAVNLMRSQGMDFELHVHIAGDNYSYPIFIENIVSRIHVNNESVTLTAPIVIHGGNCIFGDAGKMVFNFASGTDAIITYSCDVYIAALPQLSGTATTVVNATYNSRLFVPQDITFPRVVLSRSLAFVKNSTNFVANLSAIFTS